METLEESLFAGLSERSTEEEIVDVILTKLCEDQDKVCYCFKNLPAFLTKKKVLRIVNIMTNKYWLAHATSEEDYTDIGLKVTRHGISICKQGGLVKHLGSQEKS